MAPLAAQTAVRPIEAPAHTLRELIARHARETPGAPAIGGVAQAPLDYQRRQTLKNAERYITPELKEFEDKVLSANSKALAREKILYDALLDTLIIDLAELQQSAYSLAELDVLQRPVRLGL